MTNFIERQAAIDFLLDKGMITAAIYIERIPNANAVEVVRCNECIHRPYVVPAKYNSRGQCEKYSCVDSIDDVCPYICDDRWYNLVPKDNFFCAYGERKETDDVGKPDTNDNR